MMDNPSAADGAQQTPQSAASTAANSSPAVSLFSRGHVSRGSGSTSSLASSPITRDSFDLYGSTKRLEDVREDPSEREEEDYDVINAADHYILDGYGPGVGRMSFDQSPPNSPPTAQYSLGDQDAWSTTSSGRHHFKRARSVEYNRSSVTNRIASRFPSLSKRWKHKSAAGPQLSIVTHMDATSSRNSSGASSQLISPALSAISKHESYLPTSPIRIGLEASFGEIDSEPVAMEKDYVAVEEPQAQATTPLLPPIFTQLSSTSPIQSPLQYPSIAANQTFLSSPTPAGTPVLPTLPSPPLSTKPSLTSIYQRSRTNTANLSTSDIPHLQMLDDAYDPWAQRLGHANFNIVPEPYAPSTIDLDSYRDFRAQWDLARRNYAKHLARTGEHYGTTSKVYLLTQDKWESIDKTWKSNNEKMTAVLNPILARISDGDTTVANSTASSAVLEKPVTRVVVPQLDDSTGKFPALGDEDIVGPMSTAPARSPTMKKDSDRESPPQSPRKRNLFKFLSDILGGSKPSNT